MKPSNSQLNIQPERRFMEAAIREAIRAKKAGDHAIGAVIVLDGQIIAKAGNRIRLDEDPTGHAEILAIKKATRKLGKRHLENCVLYSTHEPCPMCAATAVFAKMAGIVSGAKIADFAEYRQNNGNKSWRTIDVPASLIIQKSDQAIFLVEEFMREECKKLFHN